MQAEIITNGSLPFARCKGFSFARFSDELAVAGIDMRGVVSPDNGMRDALRTAFARSHIVVVIGAPDPAADTTRADVCAAVGMPLVRDETRAARMRKRFAARGERTPDAALAMCDFPEDAVSFEGVTGFTSGFAIRSGNQCLVILPGYPPDLGPMLAVDVFHALVSFSGAILSVRECSLYSTDLPGVERVIAAVGHPANGCLAAYTVGRCVYLRAVAADDTRSRAEALSSRLIQAALESMPGVPSLLLPGGDALDVVARTRARFEAPESDVPSGAQQQAAPPQPRRGLESEPKPQYDPGVRPYETPQGLETTEPEVKSAPAAPPKKDKRKIVRRVVLAVIIVTFVTSIGYIGWYFLNSHINAQMASELSAAYDDGASIPEGYPSAYLPSFASLWAINPDVKGWLEIEGTGVAYPAVQSSDNDYYLRRDFKGQHNDHGVVFLDFRSEIEPTDTSDNIVAYGHNMRDGQMFGELTSYTDLAYYQAHPTLTFDTVYRKAEWKVMAVFTANTLAEHGEVFRYTSFVNAADAAEFDAYVQNCLLRSQIVTGVDAVYGDRLLTLSTCIYPFSDARLVIVARRVRDGEDPSVNVNAAYLNPDPLMPDVWYELYGGAYGGIQPPAQTWGLTGGSAANEQSQNSASSQSSRPESGSSGSSSMPESSSSSSSSVPESSSSESGSLPESSSSESSSTPESSSSESGSIPESSSSESSDASSETDASQSSEESAVG